MTPEDKNWYRRRLAKKSGAFDSDMDPEVVFEAVERLEESIRELPPEDFTKDAVLNLIDHHFEFVWNADWDEDDDEEGEIHEDRGGLLASMRDVDDEDED